MGEHLARDIGWVLAAVVLLAVLLFGLMSLRRWLLELGGGTVECSLRDLQDANVWRLGIGRYQGDELQWHRIFGFRRRPRKVIHRRGLVVLNRREPEGEEIAALTADAAIIEVKNGDLAVELAMSPAALTGFLVWLESSPPGWPVDLPDGA
ncbi:DUF2550 domain-containing protein [Actinocorallia populi]|uniref:DUF2550 domain-containing protein n=1 Tax=Actinocorallia populi TaxID=2079200 RepID=UPI000D09342F|nr:DUF2550 domain-containing protein [Actinocorallia populi]